MEIGEEGLSPKELNRFIRSINDDEDNELITKMEKMVINI